MIQDLVRLLKRLDIVYMEPNSLPIKLKHGDISKFYVDVKKAYGSQEALNLLADCMYEIIDKRATCVAGEGYGGVPLATAIASRHGLKLTLVRDKPKQHGRISRLDGYIPVKGVDKVIIVDDVCTTGGSLKRVNEIITENSGAEILEYGFVVLREKVELGLTLKYLIVPKDLM